MRYRHFLFVGLVGAASLVGACFDGDDDDDSKADAGPPDGADGGAMPGTDATVADGAPKPTTDAATGADGSTDGGNAADASPMEGGPLGIPARCNGSVASPSNPVTPPSGPGGGIGIVDGFMFASITKVTDGPRQLVALPNGDLLIGTNGGNVDIVTNADGLAGTGASAPTVFATFADGPAQGITYDPTTCTIYVGTQHGIYSMPYVDGQLKGTVGSPIASIRTVAPDAGHNDDIHTTTSLAVVPGGKLYAAVGSDCNACVEVDPTRATIQQMNLDGSQLATRATRVRNAIALSINPATGTLWAGGAGQDDLPTGHPYEYFDAVTSHAGIADYGWPDCEENQVAYTTGANCSGTVIPLIEMPPYQTIIGALFYPNDNVKRTYGFPAAYRGGVFITGHGSWHKNASNGFYTTPPRVAFVAMNGDTPAIAADFTDPSYPTDPALIQYSDFVYGFQNTSDGTRLGRPTGIVMGPQGTVFIADDLSNLIYRIRPFNP